MSQPLNVLLVEDSESDAALIVRVLQQSDFTVNWQRVERADDMRAALLGNSWDVVISDFRMPRFEAPEALTELQNTGLDIPFILVSGKIGEALAVKMMKQGAHDYVMKDNLSRLPAAITRELDEARNRQDRKRIQQALHDSEKRNRLILESTSDAFVVMDTAGIVREWNDQASGLFGWSVDETIGKPLAQLIIPERDREAHRQGLERYLGQRESRMLGRRFTIGALHREGHEVRVEMIINAIDLGEDTIFTAFMHDVTYREKYLENIQRLSAFLINAQEEERARIARDIHDDYSQQLAHLAIGIQSLGMRGEPGHEEFREQTNQLWEQTRQLSAQLHDLSYELAPVKLRQLGLKEGLKHLCKDSFRLYELPITSRFRHVPDKVGEQAELCLYRIAQEAIKNTVSHSRSADAELELVGESGHLSMVIRDFGDGFEYDPESFGSGLGLVSMRERARLINGQFKIDSRPGEGTEISVSIPLPAGYGEQP